MANRMSPAQQLEQYSQCHPDEILVITIKIQNQQEQIMIYKGFSSSLTQATDFNPDIPLIPDTATILQIDRLKSPYDPQNPHYLEQGLRWETLQQRWQDESRS